MRLYHLITALLLIALLAGCKSPANGPALARYPVEAKLLPRGIDAEQPPSSALTQGALPASGALDDYMSVALGAHPALAGERARWSASVSRVAQEDVLPNPWVVYGFAPLPVQTRNGPLRHTLSVMQTFPWPGSRARSIMVQREQVQERALVYREQAWRVHAEVSEHYWALWLLDARTHVVREQIALLQTLEENLRAGVEIGNRPASSLGDVAIALVETQSTLHSIENQRGAHRARMIAAMGLEWSGQVLTATPASRPSMRMPAMPLQKMWATHPPDVLTLQARAAVARARAEKERLRSKPLLQLGAQWSSIGTWGAAQAANPGRDALMVSVGAQAPLFFRSADRAREDAADAEVVAANASTALAIQAWRAQVQQLHARLSHVVYRHHLLETALLPLAHSNYEAVLGDYVSDRTSSAAIMSAARRILELRLEHIELEAAHATLWASLEALLGRHLHADKP